MTKLPNEEQIFKNTNLIYDYTESMFLYSKSLVDNIDYKLATIIGFSGVVLKFTFDLPGKESISDYECYSCLILKILSVIGATASICISVYGFIARPMAIVVSSRELHKKWLNEQEESSRLYISRTWRNAIEDLEKARDKKIQYLNSSLICLSIVSILFGIDIIINSIFN